VRTGGLLIVAPEQLQDFTSTRWLRELLPARLADLATNVFGACYKIPANQREKTVGDVLELVGLSEKRGAIIGALSRGMQQRLGLARVLIHDPQILLLDEPASGLDPRARIEMLAIPQELQRLGKAISISSHILGELETLCNRVAIIEKGTPHLHRRGPGRSRSDE
jgi:ABC-2 type transport system ATP-binding protein